jgi:hypothetical protein
MGAKRRTSSRLPVPLDVLHRMGAERRATGADRRCFDVLLARLATSQDGVVGRAQIAVLGFSRREIEVLVRTRRLIRVHRGVYAVGHEALSDRGRMIAALLAAGPGAFLSHRTAAYLWKLIPSLPPFIEVTFTDRIPRRRQGLRVHQAHRLDTMIHQGLLVTTPLQTIAQLPPDDRDRARAEALVFKLIARGADDDAEPTRSELERALRPALKTARLPRPVVGAELLGYTVVRFTWRQVIHETLLVTVRIAQLLTRAVV